jgi:anti-anti-sigma factor
MDAYFRVEVMPDGTVALEGELDAGSAHLLTEVVEILPNGTDDTLVLDLSDLTFIDAAGARSLARLGTACPHRSVVAKSVRRNVARVCDLMPGVLPPNVTLERAHRRFRRDRSAAGNRLAAAVAIARRVAERNARLRSAIVWVLRRWRALRRRVRTRIAAFRKRRPPRGDSLAPGSR